MLKNTAGICRTASRTALTPLVAKSDLNVYGCHNGYQFRNWLENKLQRLTAGYWLWTLPRSGRYSCGTETKRNNRWYLLMPTVRSWTQPNKVDKQFDICQRCHFTKAMPYLKMGIRFTTSGPDKNSAILWLYFCLNTKTPMMNLLWPRTPTGLNKTVAVKSLPNAAGAKN